MEIIFNNMQNHNVSYLLRLTQNGQYIAINRNDTEQFRKLDITVGSTLNEGTFDLTGSSDNGGSGIASLKGIITRNKSLKKVDADNPAIFDLDTYCIMPNADNTDQFTITQAYSYDFPLGSHIQSGVQDYTDWCVFLLENATEEHTLENPSEEGTLVEIRVILRDGKMSPLVQWTNDIEPIIEENV